MQSANATLDARGLTCPLPILRTKKSLSGLDSGETLMMLSSDPGSVKDIESFCQQTGNRLIDSSVSDGEFQFLILKS